MAPAGTACGRNGITNWSRFVPVAEALSRLVPNSDSSLILLIRHAQDHTEQREDQEVGILILPFQPFTTPSRAASTLATSGHTALESRSLCRSRAAHAAIAY